MAEPIFFTSGKDFYSWLEAHHDTETELLVGFHKTATGIPSLTWPESVDQALCFGWIDGVRRSLGPEAYTIRFTPRKRRSNWSNVNVAKVEHLTELGLMRPAGSAAFAARDPARTGVYSSEAGDLQLDDSHEREFRRNEPAWSWFEKQAPSYRRAAIHWVVSAKKEETRRSRLAMLIDDAAHGRRVKPLRPPGTQ